MNDLLESDKIREVEFLPDRLNGEPVAFLGLTNSEMFLIVKAGAALWFPMGLFVCFLLGMTLMGIGFGAVCTLLNVLVGGKILQKQKRGKPENFHVRAAKLFAQAKSFGHFEFVQYHGPWSAQRAMATLKERL